MAAWHNDLMDDDAKLAIDRSIDLTNSLLTIIQALCSRLVDLFCSWGCSVCNYLLIRLVIWSAQLFTNKM